HVRRLGLQVGQVDQLAVLHLPAVAPVDDVVVAVAAAVVEVPGAVRHGRVRVLGVGGPRGAGAGGRTAGHVVDHRVDVDLHPGGVTGPHHAGERGPGAAAAGQLEAHR